MPKLRDPSGEPVHLTAEHTVGRSSSCRLRLVAPEVSGHHAVIRWTGEAWELRDLGSRNGTFVNGVVLESGQRRVLDPGQTLSFGSAEPVWTVEDIGPPEPVACSASGAWQEGDDGLLLLPDAESALVCVYEESGRWIAEEGEVARPVADGATIELDEQSWTLFLPSRVAGTRESQIADFDLSRAQLCFRVSQDEEHVEAVLIDGEHRLELPHRAHLYVVLSLARARIADAEDPEISESERGWVYQEQVARDHRIPANQFNVVLFRARRQLKRAGVRGADELIERRRGSGQLRLGLGDVRVEAL